MAVVPLLLGQISSHANPSPFLRPLTTHDFSEELRVRALVAHPSGEPRKHPQLSAHPACLDTQKAVARIGRRNLTAH